VESTNIDQGLRPVLALPTASPGNPLQSFVDWGGEAGGPLLKSKLWYWGDWTEQIITSGDDKVYKSGSDCAPVAANQTAYPWAQVRACTNSDPVYLKHFAYKAAYSPFKGNTFTFENRYDVKEQQHFQFSPLRPIETTVVLKSPYDSFSRGPRFWDAGWPTLWRIADQQVVNDHLVLEFALLHFAKSNEQFLQSTALNDVQVQFEQSTQQYAKSQNYTQAYQPMTSFKGTANYFRPGFLGGNNTFKVGAYYSQYDNYETQGIGGQAQAIFNSAANAAPFTTPLAVNFYRSGIFEGYMLQTAAYIQDTYTRKRLTLNLGIRYDRQDDKENPESVAPSEYQGQLMADGKTVFNFLPAVSYPGAHAPVVWSTFAPRIGATYDLFGSGKTILKASYDRYYDMRFAGQLSDAYNTITTATSNQGATLSFVQFPWNDANHDGIVQMNEVTPTIRAFGGQYNPQNPSQTSSPNSVDPGIRDPHTDEVLAGVSQQLPQGFGLDVSYVYRHYTDFIWNRINGISSADYAPVNFTPPAASCPSVPAPMTPTQCAPVTYFNPTKALTSAFTVANQPGYTRTYEGVDIALKKNMSKNWMFQGALTLQSTIQNWKNSDSYQDPTNIAQQNGKQYAPAITGYTIPVNTNARWILRGGGQYRAWKGIAVSGTTDLRQGYPIVNTINIASRTNGAASIPVYIEPPGVHRFHRLATVDLRVDRKFEVWNERLSLTPAIDLYNAFNASTILAQQPNQNASNANRIGAIVGPRVARFGILARF
jgi:hypothetical protein